MTCGMACACELGITMRIDFTALASAATLEPRSRSRATVIPRYTPFTVLLVALGLLGEAGRTAHAALSLHSASEWHQHHMQHCLQTGTELSLQASAACCCPRCRARHPRALRPEPPARSAQRRCTARWPRGSSPTACEQLPLRQPLLTPPPCRASAPRSRWGMVSQTAVGKGCCLPVARCDPVACK